MIASSAKARISGARRSASLTSRRDLASARVFTGTSREKECDIATILSARVAECPSRAVAGQ